MKQPLTRPNASDISVVIPTFRLRETLAQTISSMLAQSGTTIEILVVNDCPLGSAEGVVARIYDKRVTYITNPKPSGGRSATVRDIAWPQAYGTLLRFLDGDGVAPEGLYQAVLHAFSCTRQVGVVLGLIAPFDCDESRLAHEVYFFSPAAQRPSSCQRLGLRTAFTARMLFDEAMLVCSAGVIRRECVAAVNGFDPKLPMSQNVNFFARIFQRFGAHFIFDHRPDSPSLVLQSSRRMLAKYRADWGHFEFYGLKSFERILRVVPC